MTKEEFYEKWDRNAKESQSACNALALLNHGKELLSDWRMAGGKWNGEDCPHLKFFLYQLCFLTFGREPEWEEWSAEYAAIEKRSGTE